MSYSQVLGEAVTWMNERYPKMSPADRMAIAAGLSTLASGAAVKTATAQLAARLAEQWPDIAEGLHASIEATERTPT